MSVLLQIALGTRIHPAEVQDWQFRVHWVKKVNTICSSVINWLYHRVFGLLLIAAFLLLWYLEPKNYCYLDKVSSKLQISERVRGELRISDIVSPKLQTTDRVSVKLQTTDRVSGELQTADTMSAKLQTTDRVSAKLQTTDRVSGELQTTDTVSAKLQTAGRMNAILFQQSENVT